MCRIIFVMLLAWTTCFHLNCTFNSNKKVNEVWISAKVKQGFVSNYDNEDVVINKQKYWVLYKVKYKNDTLESFQRFYPEGPISYSIDELKNDTAIYTSRNIPFIQNWAIIDNHLFENNINTNIELEELDKKHYKEKEGQRIFVVQ
jgi:hypothetical protein